MKLKHLHTAMRTASQHVDSALGWSSCEIKTGACNEAWACPILGMKRVKLARRQWQ